MRRVLFIGPMLLALAFAGAHCSSSTTSGGGGDAGGGSDSGADSSTADSGGGTDSSSDAPAIVNGCGTADFADHTAASDARAITFPGDSELPAQYAPPCIKIKVGQSVTWNGGFTAHPIEPAGGDTNTPILATSGVTTKSFAFPNAGTFGFECANHPLSMKGAVFVVP